MFCFKSIFSAYSFRLFHKTQKSTFFQVTLFIDGERERESETEREREEIYVENESIKQIECFLIDLSLIDAIGEH